MANQNEWLHERLQSAKQRMDSWSEWKQEAMRHFADGANRSEETIDQCEEHERKIRQSA